MGHSLGHRGWGLVMVSDEAEAELEHLAKALGVTLEELLKRSVAAYLPQVKAELAWSQPHIGCASLITTHKDKPCCLHSWRATFNRVSSSS